MKSTWLHRHSRQALIVFCNGWGMDDRPFRHLEADRCDVLMLWDYRQMTPAPDIAVLDGQYAEIYLVGWSMGVWAGQRMFSPVREHFQAAIAVNGTLCPIHDRFGIPEATITGTLRNFSEVSRGKLYQRMCRDRQGRLVFQENLPARSLDGQKEELQALMRTCDCRPAEESLYSHVMVADKDAVMPTANQLQFWQAADPRVVCGGHFPFHLWPSWDAFLAAAMRPGTEATTGSLREAP
jgi:biotin synthesis protein BioG